MRVGMVKDGILKNICAYEIGHIWSPCTTYTLVDMTYYPGAQIGEPLEIQHEHCVEPTREFETPPLVIVPKPKWYQWKFWEGKI